MRTNEHAYEHRDVAFLHFFTLKFYIYRFEPSTALKNIMRTKRLGMAQSVWMKPMGMENGPKCTPESIGDAWQNYTSYEVEEV